MHQQKNWYCQHLHFFGIAFRLPSHPCQEVSKQTIVSFHRKSFLFRLYMFLFGNYAFIRFPRITGNIIHFVLFYLFPKFFRCFISSVANNEIDESFPISINSNPRVLRKVQAYPTVVFFEPIPRTSYLCPLGTQYKYKSAFRQLQPSLLADCQNLTLVLFSRSLLSNLKLKHC